jgi:oxepin-CoA hydrolase/3-oxo-5,6-dehydrosuberyl-CoA semialdehyde dehydrogenase|nr:3,4-dehydroadipyl-CoA semialdehyde dehydrogenase [Kofleriaceae bacterium]
MQLLASYVAGAWSPGSGSRTTLVNPATEAPLAETHASHDVAAAFAHARGAGVRELGALTFAQRGALLAALAKAVHAGREELIALAVANGGNTRSDAKFDIDGAAVTLSHYAELGGKLGSAALLGDGEPIQVGRTARMGAQHVYARRRGVAVHINAFNFPAWGTCEKLACSLLAGVPAISKPATATALVAHRLAELFAPLLPAGALQLYLGSGAALLDHVGEADCVAFTGGSATARAIRGHARVVAHNVRLNLEADSLNAAVLAPDVEAGSETFGLFVADVARDITQKTGQKCTAIRRVLVPTARRDEVCDALRERLAGIAVGDPSRDDVRMGPVATAAQLADVRAGIARLAAATASVHGGTGDIAALGADGKGYFVGPVVRATDDAMGCAVLHDHEVFGPVSTVATYDGDAGFAADFIARGAGCLVSSAYADDRDWVARFVGAAAGWAGRLYLGSQKMAAQSPGPGTVLPSLVHGGPGRAGGGEELGGERGLHFYMQRCALEGDASVLKSLL